MKRQLYFWLERLEIKRSERIAISISLVLLVFSSGFFALLQPKANYDPDHYKELEQIFAERSQTLERERGAILARYEPDLADEPELAAAVRDTTPPDTTEEKTEQPSEDLININHADAEELQELPGIGPAYSQRIIEWREENGAFTSKEQLLEIRGIGERRLENIAPLIEL